jgi:hypothetical protein
MKVTGNAKGFLIVRDDGKRICYENKDFDGHRVGLSYADGRVRPGGGISPSC